jgi:hypothetical protein
MGTRGAFGFRIDGEDKVTYNHFDSYPASLGLTVVQYVKNHDDEELREVARRIVLVDGRKDCPPELARRYSKFSDFGVSKQRSDDWYCVLRNAQGEPEAWHQGLDHMVDKRDFLADSLFCEYAYIVNLDDGTLEFYKGFNKDRSAPGRYAALERGKQYEEDAQEYSGVRLVEAAPLSAIRDGGNAAIVKHWDKLTSDEDDDG